jgi:hypothetical protein
VKEEVGLAVAMVVAGLKLKRSLYQKEVGSVGEG